MHYFIWLCFLLSLLIEWNDWLLCLCIEHKVSHLRVAINAETSNYLVIKELFQPRVTNTAKAAMLYVPAFKLLCCRGGDKGGVYGIIGDIINVMFCVIELKLDKIVQHQCSVGNHIAPFRDQGEIRT